MYSFDDIAIRENSILIGHALFNVILVHAHCLCYTGIMNCEAVFIETTLTNTEVRRSG